MRRFAVLLGVAVSLVLSATPASAKGHVPSQGFAVITGPGLPHPIVYVAPWKASSGGFYSTQAEYFLGLANLTGATPAGRLQQEGGGYIPYGVLPIDYKPSVVAFTPRYRLTWFRDGVTEVAKQDLYPYASAGPVVYTYPSSRRALVEIFGRFQTPKSLWTGWGRATTFDLLKALQFHGLPMVAPEVRVPQGAPSQLPAASPDAGLAGGTMASLPQGGSAWVPAALVPTLLLVLVLALFWVRRRRRETTVMHDVGA